MNAFLKELWCVPLPPRPLVFDSCCASKRISVRATCASPPLGFICERFLCERVGDLFRGVWLVGDRTALRKMGFL